VITAHQTANTNSLAIGAMENEAGEGLQEQQQQQQQQQQQPGSSHTLKVWLSWSSGKDCAYSLFKLRQQPDIEVVGLLTTVNEAADRVAMHAVRTTLLRMQAAAAGLPVYEVGRRSVCSSWTIVLRTHLFLLAGCKCCCLLCSLDQLKQFSSAAAAAQQSR
jgi:hypothetical protein